MGFRGATSFCVLSLASRAEAADINVTTTAIGDPVQGCGLLEAIVAVNTKASHGGCAYSTPAGGVTKIVLPAGTYALSGSLSIQRPTELAGVTSANTVITQSAQAPIIDDQTSKLTIRNITLQGASSLLQDGIDLNAANTNLTLDHARVTSNGGFGIWAGQGGATISIASSQVDANGTGDPQGMAGIYAFCANVSVTASTVSSNRGSGIVADSDIAVCSSSKDLSVRDSTIAGNVSTGWGGGILHNPSGGAQTMRTLHVDNSTFANNSAQLGGGLADFGHAWLTNNTITSNHATAGEGGGIYRDSSGEFTIQYCTVSHNSATVDAGGVYTASGSFYPFSNIFAKNTAPTDPDFHGFASTGPTYYNLIQNPGSSTGWCPPTNWDPNCGGPGHAIFGLDPLLGSLANNGGPTQTRALPATSPAVDVNPNGVLVTTNTDQRGAARLHDGNGDGTAKNDLGAYER